jgi:hypothetical protein
MRPEEFVIGLERSEHERGMLQEHEEEFEQGDAKPYDEQVAENRIEDRSHHGDVLAVVKAIFEERTASMPALDQLELSAQERSALDALRTAYGGREGRYNTFVYAEQRRELLEQALSALQPILALDVSASAELRENYERMVEQVTELRERLVNLEDSQDDEMLQRESPKKTEESGADDGDKDDKDDDAEPGLDDQPSTLFDGPAAPEKTASTSSLFDGAAAPEKTAAASTLFDGPAVDAPVHRSRLLDEEGSGSGGAAGAAAASGGEAAKGGVLSRLGRALGIGKNDGDKGGKGDKGAG